MQFPELANAVDSFRQTGNLSCTVVFVINTLGCCFADCRDSLCKSSLCSSFIVFLNCSFYFFDGSFNLSLIHILFGVQHLRASVTGNHKAAGAEWNQNDVYNEKWGGYCFYRWRAYVDGNFLR